MRAITAIVSAILVGTVIVFGLIWPAMYQAETDADMPDLSGRGKNITWYCPVFDDSGRVCGHVPTNTPTGISRDDYVRAFSDTDIPRENWMNHGLCVADCPDTVIRNLAQSVRNAGGDMDCYTEREICITIQAFVMNGIYYLEDRKLYGCSDYAATPTETLYLHLGDCEDVSILYVSIARAYGIDSTLIKLDGHCMAGVRIAGYKGIVSGYTPVECTHTNYTICRLYTDTDCEILRAYEDESFFDGIARTWMRYCNKTSGYNPILYIVRMLS